MVGPLAGRCIWLTRPAHQAGAWATVLEAAGARVVREPLLVIEPPDEPDAVRRQLAAAERADIVIATSSNAVRGAWRLAPDFAPSGTLLAVGPATATALEAASGRSVVQPARAHTSEGLLALACLQAPAGARMALLAGAGGRCALAKTLGARGAQVDKLALYRRRPATIARARLAALIDAADAVIVTSGEALARLLALVDDVLAARLAATVLVAPSARVVKQLAGACYWTTPPVVPARMSGEDVAAALARRWRGRQK